MILGTLAFPPILKETIVNVDDVEYVISTSVHTNQRKTCHILGPAWSQVVVGMLRIDQIYLHIPKWKQFHFGVNVPTEDVQGVVDNTKCGIPSPANHCIHVRILLLF